MSPLTLESDVSPVNIEEFSWLAYYKSQKETNVGLIYKKSDLKGQVAAYKLLIKMMEGVINSERTGVQMFIQEIYPDAETPMEFETAASFLKEDQDSKRTENLELENKNFKLKKEKEELLSQVKEADMEIKAASESISNLDKLLETQISNTEKVTSESNDWKIKFEETEQSAQNLKSELIQLQEKSKADENQISELADLSETFSKNLENCKTKLAAEVTEKEVSIHQNRTLQKNVRILTEDLKEAEEQLSRSMQQKEKLRNEFSLEEDSLKKSIKTLKSDNEDLEDSLRKERKLKNEAMEQIEEEQRTAKRKIHSVEDDHDLKLKQIQAEHQKIEEADKNKVDQFNREIMSLTKLNSQLETNLKEHVERIESKANELGKAEGAQQELQDLIKTKEMNSRSQQQKLESQVQLQLEQNEVMIGKQRESLAEIADLRAENEKMGVKLKNLGHELTDRELNSDSLSSKVRMLQETKEENEIMIKQLLTKMDGLDQRCRNLNEVVCSLKGTIRVMLRVRPLLTTEEKRIGNNHLKYGYDEEGRDMISISTDKGVTKCAVDKIITEQTSQIQVFNEMESIVQSGLNGHNVCVFAYGQTGSGKTFSMEGPEEPNEETKGIIPRCIGFMINQAKKNPIWEYEFSVNYVEIYCNKVFDLISKGKQHTEIKARLLPDGVKYEPNLSEWSIKEVHDIQPVIDRASTKRRTASTDFNARSSRSHSIFILKIKATNKTNPKLQQTSQVQLIDLAGSENAKSSGASSGQAKEEAKHINQSLSSLTRCIQSLRNKETHINFRDGELTKVLKPSLTRTSKVLMLVHLNPSLAQVTESIFTAKFAESANSTKIGNGKNKAINNTIS
jgi:kinesin family protein C1